MKRSGAFSDLFDSDEQLENAVKRARAYYLVNALVQSLVKQVLQETFDLFKFTCSFRFSVAPALMGNSVSSSEPEGDEQRTISYEDADLEGEDISLLSESIKSSVGSRASGWKRKLVNFLNPPLLGSLAAFILGIIPFFHNIFFEKGHFFTNTVTQSLYKVGDLYAAVQVFILGAQLSRSHQRLISFFFHEESSVYCLV